MASPDKSHYEISSIVSLSSRVIQSIVYADLIHAGLLLLTNDDNDGSEAATNLLIILSEQFEVEYEEVFELAEIFATLLWYDSQH